MKNIIHRPTTKMPYKIRIAKRDFDQLLENTKQDPSRSNARNFVGTWITCFEKSISEHEKMTIRLQGNLSRLYMEGKRSDAAFLRGNATCKDCNAKYQLSINDKPSNDESFVIVLVIRSNEHLHNHNNR